MLQRIKWQIEEERTVEASSGGLKRQNILDLIAGDRLISHFQPIFSAVDGSIFGYEALARLTGELSGVDISGLFTSAAENQCLCALDIACRETALRSAAAAGCLGDRFLFLNICPETLMDPQHRAGRTDRLIEEYKLCKAQIVLEITEEFAVKDYQLFAKAVAYYREQGYKIAIDDFGAGYGGLKMLSLIEPDFVKIDRHFVSHMDRALVRYNLVDSIATACHRMGIKVVAEGIERQEDLNVLIEMGIDYLQGYHLARPSAEPSSEAVALPCREESFSSAVDTVFVGDIARRVEPIDPSTAALHILERFMQESHLKGLPVVKDEQVLGMLVRNLFLEKELLGRFGYGLALSTYKTAAQLMGDHSFLCMEANHTIEEVAQRLQSRDEELLNQDLCITKNGKYHGTVAVSKLLKAMSERNLFLARAANPLTGLPGSLFIQSEIEKRIARSMYFDAAYIDIDNFKPFNDHYGFEKGDHIIKALGNIVQGAIDTLGDQGFAFVGHIGGDDFILVCRAQHTDLLAKYIIAAFESRRTEFHGIADSHLGSYLSTNRRGEAEQFPLLSLSIGVVSSEVHKVASFGQLASLASEVKKAAKLVAGSSVVVDRRLES